MLSSGPSMGCLGSGCPPSGVGSGIGSGMGSGVGSGVGLGMGLGFGMDLGVLTTTARGR